MSSKVDLTEVSKRLETSLEDLFKNDRFQDLLNVMASGHNYSFHNALLIASQYPDATMIRGFKQWQALGRHVLKGEKSIEILVPTFQKEVEQTVDKETVRILEDEHGDPQVNVKETISGYVFGKVFDVSQTSGRDLPNVRDFVQNDLQSEESLSELYDRFVQNVNTDEKNPLSIQEAHHELESYGGFYNRSTDEIVINTAVSNTTDAKFRVVIHEYAHGLLHNKDNEMNQYARGHKEAQAESAAYIVSKYYGLDTNLTSTGYIATWAQDLNIAKQAIREVQQVSNQMIEQINSLQSEKINEFYQSINPSRVRSELEEKLQIDLNDYPTMQLVDPKNGLVLFAKVEENTRDNQLILRTNTNRLVPLSDLESRYHVINVLENKNKISKEVKKVEDFMKVTKIDDGKYAVTLEGGKTSERTFAKKIEGQKFIQKTAIAQSLNTERFLSVTSVKEINHLQNKNEKQLNERVGKYIKAKNFKVEHQHNITLGWHLMKNPLLQSQEALEKNIESLNPHQSHTKELKDAISSKEKQQELEK
ncbi:ArdC family protein [Paenisporosarcina sp. NPDC076898]|uniref:ArdC family protein n=1 Tax=unclassified Paenisporosarcina TaxID=2642018 RepID=UPI003D024108